MCLCVYVCVYACVGVLPVKGVMREGGGGERKREGRCQMQGGRQEEGGRHTRAHSLYCPRAAEGEVRKRKEKKGKKTRWCQSSKNIFKPSLSTSDHI